MIRKIIHLDLDAFFCAVELLRNPELGTTPFAVGGQPDARGVVSSCSYSARMMGIRSAMSMKLAVKLCPNLVILSPDHNEYRNYSNAVIDYLKQVSPIVEQISIDEAFLDISDMPENPKQVAYTIQATILNSLQLPSSLGIGSNKLVAKIANDFGKSQNKSPYPPMAVTYVPPGTEEEFLAPLPVTALWGVGPKNALRLNEMGILTIGDLAKWSEESLAARFGKYGHELYKASKGHDNRPVVTSHETKSISQETTFAQDIKDPKLVKLALRDLSENVGSRLRSMKLKAKTIKVKIRLYNFTTITRQITLPLPTDQSVVIIQVAEKLLNENWGSHEPIRLVGIGVSGLDTNPRQLDFFNSVSEREQKLQIALDDLHSRFGKQSIRKGKLKN